MLASLELYQRLGVAHKHSMACCAIVCITALILSTMSAVAGVDQLFERSPAEQTWGERLTEIKGDDDFSKCYALVIGISDYFDGYADHRTLLDDIGLLLNEGLSPQTGVRQACGPLTRRRVSFGAIEARFLPDQG